MKNTNEIEVGDILLVAGKDYGHQFEIGSIVEVTNIRYANSTYAMFECTDGKQKSYWWLSEYEVEKLGTTNSEPEWFNSLASDLD